ncbi:hypothetical protein D3C86_2244840 [compost metagenome]
MYDFAVRTMLSARDVLMAVADMVELVVAVAAEAACGLNSAVPATNKERLRPMID